MDMRAIILFWLLITMAFPASSQGRLESHFIGSEQGEKCTIKIRDLNEFKSVRRYEFTDVLRLVMDGGDYLVTYWADTLFLHGEYIHFSVNDNSVIQKFIMRRPMPLQEFDFQQLKFIRPENFEDLYMEF